MSEYKISLHHLCAMEERTTGERLFKFANLQIWSTIFSMQRMTMWEVFAPELSSHEQAYFVVELSNNIFLPIRNNQKFTILSTTTTFFVFHFSLCHFFLQNLSFSCYLPGNIEITKKWLQLLRLKFQWNRIPRALLADSFLKAHESSLVECLKNESFAAWRFKYLCI